MVDDQPAQTEQADDTFFGPWLRRRRRSRDLTQDALAQSVGCAVDTLRKFEAGMRRPSRPMAERLAHCLAIPLAEQAAFLTAARSGCAPRDGSLSLMPTPATTRLPTPARRIGYLPASMTSFIGREWEITTVAARLQTAEVRLVTLTGTGGVGKTRLALQIASALKDAFPDGVWFVNLAPISDPALVLPTIAQALGIREQAGTPIAETLQTVLFEQQVLVLLDNFEQVIGAAPKLAALLADLPTLKLLVTSREALRLYGEHIVVVAPLAVPKPSAIQSAEQLTHYAAVQLFLERAQAAAQHFRLSDANAPAVAAICTRLDGLPLAIELAAAQIARFSPSALLVRLEQRLPLLTRGPRDMPARQQTIRDTIAWSYDLLAPDEQHLFARLAVFVGGATIAAVESICGNADEHRSLVLERITALIDKSLIRQIEQEPDTLRFVMLETIREFALERLDAADESVSLRERHAAYFLNMAESADAQMYGPESGVWFNRLEADDANLHSALAWSCGSRGEPAIALRLTAALLLFWLNRRPSVVGQRWIERALALPYGHELRPLRASALNAAGRLAIEAGDRNATERFLSESLALYEQLEDVRSCSEVLSHLGVIHYFHGNIAQAASDEEASLRTAQQAGSQDRAGWALNGLACIRAWQGQYAQAATLATASHTIFQECRDPIGRTAALFTQGITQRLCGDSDEAIRCLLASEHLAHVELGDASRIVVARTMRADIARMHGDDAEADVLMDKCRTLAQHLGSPSLSTMVHYELTLIALARQDAGVARAELDASLKYLRMYGGFDSADDVAGNLVGGLIALITKEADEACTYYRSALAQLRDRPIYPEYQRASLVLCLNGLAVALVLTSTNNSAQATRMWASAAQADDPAIHIPFGRTLLHVPDFDQDLLIQVQASARAALGEAAFDAAWTAGCALSLEQAVAEALGVTG